MLDPALFTGAVTTEAFATYWSEVDSAEVTQIHVTSELNCSYTAVIFPKAGGQTQVMTSLILAADGDSFLITKISPEFLGVGS